MILTAAMWLRIAGAAALTSVIAAAIFYVAHLNHTISLLEAQTAAQKATITTNAAQSTVAQAAQATVAEGVHRDAITVTLHEDHANAITAAPGADAPINPDLNDAGRRGLCDYAAYADDPSCARLLDAHPAQLPGAGAPSPTTTGGSDSRGPVVKP